MIKDTTHLRRRAYHRAAHAVSEYRHGHDPGRLSLANRGSPEWCQRGFNGSGDARGIRVWAITALAGMAAEIELANEGFGAAVSRTPEVLNRVDEIVHRYRQGSVKIWFQKARDFVNTEARTIRAVADQLLERGVLDSLEIELIVDTLDDLPGAHDSLAVIRVCGWDAASRESVA